MDVNTLYAFVFVAAVIVLWGVIYSGYLKDREQMTDDERAREDEKAQEEAGIW